MEKKNKTCNSINHSQSKNIFTIVNCSNICGFIYTKLIIIHRYLNNNNNNEQVHDTFTIFGN